MITTISVDSSVPEQLAVPLGGEARPPLVAGLLVEGIHHHDHGGDVDKGEQQHRVYHAQLIADAFLFHAVHRPPSITSALLTRAYRYTRIMVPAIRNTDSALPSGQLREDMN